MFTRGGMLLTSLAGLAWIIGCAQRVPTPLVRLHANRLAVHTGKISYGLYLYHWPIYLWLVRAFGHGHVIPLAVATLVLSYAAADASYRWLEKPVIKRGVRAFGGRRAGGAGAVGAFAHGVPGIGLDPVDVVTGPGIPGAPAVHRGAQTAGAAAVEVRELDDPHGVQSARPG